jgi:DNA-binding MarR family transcriptional regulator
MRPPSRGRNQSKAVVAETQFNSSGLESDSILMVEDVADAQKPKRPGKSVLREKQDQPELNGEFVQKLIGFHLRRAMMELRNNFQHASDGKIRPALSSLMQVVASNHGASQVELSKVLHINKATLVALIDSAESAGWLKRQRSGSDRRRHEVVMTPLGEKVVAKLATQTVRSEEKFRRRFTDREWATLIKYLQRIYTN